VSFGNATFTLGDQVSCDEDGVVVLSRNEHGQRLSPSTRADATVRPSVPGGSVEHP